MKPTLFLLGASLVLVFVGECRGVVIFSQDFSSSSTVSDYVNATTPSSSQWNAVSTSGPGTSVSIASGALEFARTANAGSFTRNTDFSPLPTAMIYSFNLKVSGITAAATTAATWYVGNGFSTPNTAPSPIGDYVNSRFSIEFNADGSYNLKVSSAGGAASSAFTSGTDLALTWVINNSGSALSYVGPDSSPDFVETGTWDLWAGSSKIFDGKAADNSANTLAEIKFLFSAGSGTIAMDNFTIQAVPEPTTWALGVFGTFGGLVGIGKFVRRWFTAAPVA